jgi:cytochrome c peroxidase
MDDPSNAGIGPAVDALQPIVDGHPGVSRADLWALAAVVGAELAQRQTSDRVAFPLRFWGRVDCEDTGAPCVDASGAAVACAAKKGSFHVFPSIHMHTHEVFEYFASNFGFDQRETVAIMGAHTLGVIRPEDFGINGLNGWKLNKDVLDIGYYEELIGGTSPFDPVEVLVNQAPPWQQTFENNRRFWIGFPNGVRTVMVR